MRTTLTLNDDIVEKARKTASATGKPLKEVMNEALRLGLESMQNLQKKKYQVKTRKLGLKSNLDYNSISELLEIAEGDRYNLTF